MNNTDEVFLYQGKGEHEGQVIVDSKTKGGMQSVHRAQFLDELVKGVPPERAHFNKRLQSVEDTEDCGVILYFKDGTTAKADALIGADGIHSVTREFILGERDMASQSTFAGSVAYRGLVPMDKAVEKLGEEYAQNCMMLCGPGKLPPKTLDPSMTILTVPKAKASSATPSTSARYSMWSC